MPSPTLELTALPGPDWLHEQRRAAADRFATLTLPTPEQEVWRYSRIDDLDLSRYRPGVVTTTVAGADGLLAERRASEQFAAADAFEELAGAIAEPLVIRVPAGRAFADPVVIEHRIDEGGIMAAPVLIVEAGADSEVSIVQRFSGPDDVDVLVLPIVELRVAAAARVSYLGVNQIGRSGWLIANQHAVGERDSTISISNVSLGGHYARVRTDAVAAGQGASAKQTALYFADGDQMHDFRTTQRHEAPKTTSDLLFKGAVHDHARSVYTGLIKITGDAPGTTAYQTNRNLTLSEGAWAESVPNLEIETNDVRCSHASTVGPIDAEQRFYLESRGVPPEVAEQLIVLGFFDEVISQLPDTPLRAELRLAVASKLAAHGPALAGGIGGSR